jgi:phosphatidylglycerophosphate synthase
MQASSLRIWNHRILERLVLMLREAGASRIEISQTCFDKLELKLQENLAPWLQILSSERAEGDGLTIPGNLLCSLRFLEDFFASGKNFAEYSATSNLVYRLCRDTADIREMKLRLFQDSKKTTNGWVALKINARISIPLSRWVSRFPVHPHWITLLNLPFIIAAPYFYLREGYFAGMLGGLFFQLASVLDGCDGEIARTKCQVSKLGGWLDTFTDNASYLLFFLAVGLYPYRLFRNSHYLYAMLGALGLMTIALLATYAGMRKLGSATHQDYRRAFQKMAKSSKVLSAIDRLNFLSRRENFALGIFLLCLMNGRIAIYWLLLASIFLYSLVVLTTFPKLYRIMGKTI